MAQMVDYHKVITIEPGKPGAESEIIADYPDLTKEDIRACLRYAADRNGVP